MHYYLSRGHETSGCYELKDAKLEVMRELNEGLTILIARGETDKIGTVVTLMEEVMEYGGWSDSEYLSIGNRSWHITQCHDFDCKVMGGSW